MRVQEGGAFFFINPSCEITSTQRTIPYIILGKLFTPDPMEQPKKSEK